MFGPSTTEEEIQRGHLELHTSHHTGYSVLLFPVSKWGGIEFLISIYLVG